jgi:N-acetyltransferase
MDLPYTSMEDAFVRLEPLAESHREALREACAADPNIWQELYPYSMLGEAFDQTFAAMQKRADAGTLQPYAVLTGGRCVGVSCYSAIEHRDRRLEIGGTYYRPEVRGGAVNPAAKRLLLTRAFGGGADRVEFDVDALNLRSRAAVLKLGATQEGILRRHRLTWTGRVRDTVVFSILADEWPAVRERLDARLAAFEPANA